MTTTSIGLGGGCHWCTEAVFQSLRRVTAVSQGFIASTAPHSSFSEAVIVEFDSMAISLAVLIEVHCKRCVQPIVSGYFEM
jgi:peptide-methionine (S)-S-oxide reductase